VVCLCRRTRKRSTRNSPVAPSPLLLDGEALLRRTHREPRTKPPHRAAVRDDDGIRTTQVRRAPIQRLEYTSSTSRGVHELLDRPWRHRPLAACLLLVSRSSWRLACANSSTPSTCPNPIRAGTRRPAPRWCPVGPTSRGICVGCARLDLRRDGWCVLATSMMSSRSLLSPPLLPSPPLPSPPIRALGRGRDRRRADGAGRAVGEWVRSEVAMASFSRRGSSWRSRWATAVQSSCDVRMESRRLVSFPEVRCL